MTSRSARPARDRSIPLPGMLAVACGVGFLFAFAKFRGLQANFNESGRIVVIVTVLGIIAWGARQVITAWLPQFSQTSRFRLTRNRVMLPRPGLFHLLVMIVLFVGSLMGHSNMLMLVFAMLAGPFILNGWITYSMLKKTQVARRAPRHAMAGEPVSIHLELTNRKRVLSSRLMRVQDQISNAREQLDAGVMFARVPAGQSRSGSYRVRLMQRGRYQLGPVNLATRFPLGLVERGVVWDLPDEIIVLPQIGRMAPGWQDQQRLNAELVRRRQTRRGAFDDEFHRIREYRPGDNPRAIHWRTSARRNELMVREYHQTRDQNLRVLVDLWQPGHPTESDLERTELAVSLAATIVVEQLRRSRDALLLLGVAGASNRKWEGTTGVLGLESALETLALSEAVPTPELEELFGIAPTRRTPGLRTVLITTRPATDSAFTDAVTGYRSGGRGDLQRDMTVLHADSDQIGSIFQLPTPPETSA